MSDLFPLPRRSPFDDHVPADRTASMGQTGVQLRAQMLHSVVLTSTWHGGVKPWLAALRKTLGQRLPKQVGDTMQLRSALALRIGPEELMLVSETGQTSAQELMGSLRLHLGAELGSVLDLSHARCRIQISGEHAVDTLSKLYALDFRPQAFAVHSVMLSAHHHVPCALHRVSEQSFHAYVFTTYARDQLETFADAALEYGVAVTEY